MPRRTTGKWWCDSCNVLVDEPEYVDEGIGTYEFWGSVGVHHDWVEVCPECGEELSTVIPRCPICGDIRVFQDEEGCAVENGWCPNCSRYFQEHPEEYSELEDSDKEYLVVTPCETTTS